jgi:hypothetical protein
MCATHYRRFISALFYRPSLVKYILIELLNVSDGLHVGLRFRIRHVIIRGCFYFEYNIR